MINLISGIGAKIALFFLFIMLVFGAIHYIENKATREYMREYKIDTIEQEIEIRKKVNDILEDNRKSNPDRDGAIALERLRQRYGSTEGSEGN